MSTCSAIALRSVRPVTSGMTRERTSPVSLLTSDRTGVLSVASQAHQG